MPHTHINQRFQDYGFHNLHSSVEYFQLVLTFLEYDAYEGEAKYGKGT